MEQIVGHAGQIGGSASPAAWDLEAPEYFLFLRGSCVKGCRRLPSLWANHVQPLCCCMERGHGFMVSTIGEDFGANLVTKELLL